MWDVWNVWDVCERHHVPAGRAKVGMKERCEKSVWMRKCNVGKGIRLMLREEGSMNASEDDLRGGFTLVPHPCQPPQIETSALRRLFLGGPRHWTLMRRTLSHLNHCWHCRRGCCHLLMRPAPAPAPAPPPGPALAVLLEPLRAVPRRR